MPLMKRHVPSQPELQLMSLSELIEELTRIVYEGHWGGFDTRGRKILGEVIRRLRIINEGSTK